MSQFFVSNTAIGKEYIKITDKKEINHILNSRRLGLKNKITLFDNNSNIYQGIIENISREEVVIKIISVKKDKPRELKITIACALSKKAKMSFIVEKLSELGVCSVIPMITSRTIVKLTKAKAASKLMRWQRIAKEAAKQSSASLITKVENIMLFKEVVESFKGFDLVLIPNLEEKQTSLKDILRKNKFNNILVLIGPEGDFTKDEIKSACVNGAKAVTFGKRILKVDSACIYIASVVTFYEDF